MNLFSHHHQSRLQQGPRKLHVGCGPTILQGWYNIDIKEHPGVDEVRDVTKGLDFHDVDFVFCEHFIEHLRLDDGIRFLHDCCTMLCPDGMLRISTPNLDWVYATHYRLVGVTTDDRISDTLVINRAFHGWGHQFLYNQELLSHLLVRVGFADIAACEYGVSTYPELDNLESHQRYSGSHSMSDLIILEARAGQRPASPAQLETLLAKVREEYLKYLS